MADEGEAIVIGGVERQAVVLQADVRPGRLPAVRLELKETRRDLMVPDARVLVGGQRAEEERAIFVEEKGDLGVGIIGDAVRQAMVEVLNRSVGSVESSGQPRFCQA